jgi:hypothetical protein
MLPQSMKNSIDTTLFHASGYVGDKSSLNGALLHDINKTKTKGRVDYAVFQDKLDVFMRATSERKTCRVTYRQSTRGEVKTFCFAPVNILMYHDVLYIRGWAVPESGPAAPKYDKPWILMLHRVWEVIMEPRTWDELPDIDDSGFGMMNQNRVKAKIKFTDAAADYVSDRVWSEDQILEECDEGVILTFTASSPLELISWVLSFGAKAKLMEPEELKKEILRHLFSMLSIYDGDTQKQEK